jgi:hypothetical protein
MSSREGIERAIRKKEIEILSLEKKIEGHRAFIRGLKESLRYLPTNGVEPEAQATGLRVGTMIHKVKMILETRNRALHVNEILKALGRPVDAKNRVSVAGSIGGYVRRDEIFTKEAPNTFGLKTFTKNEGEQEALKDDEAPS